MASCCTSSVMSAFLMTAFRSDMFVYFSSPDSLNFVLPLAADITGEQKYPQIATLPLFPSCGAMRSSSSNSSLAATNTSIAKLSGKKPFYETTPRPVACQEVPSLRASLALQGETEDGSSKERIKRLEGEIRAQGRRNSCLLPSRAVLRMVSLTKGLQRSSATRTGHFDRV